MVLLTVLNKWIMDFFGEGYLLLTIQSQNTDVKLTKREENKEWEFNYIQYLIYMPTIY